MLRDRLTLPSDKLGSIPSIAVNIPTDNIYDSYQVPDINAIIDAARDHALKVVFEMIDGMAEHGDFNLVINRTW